MEMLVRVAQTGSMTSAARQMHVTPAAVSAAVRRVEESLGVRLFERTTRSIHPTDDGLVVLEGCEEVVDRWQETLENVRGNARELSGTLHISAPADTTYQILAPLIVEISEAHPKLQIVVHSSDALLHLHRDAIDMAIRYGPLSDSTLTARKLAACPLVLVAAPSYLAKWGHPQTPDELAGHRCITLQLSGVPVRSWNLSDGQSSHDVALHSPLCGDGYLARQWAISGKGIALKSLFDVIDELESGALVRVLPELAGGSMAIHAMFPSRRFLPERVRVVSSEVVAHLAERDDRCHKWLEDARS